MKLGLVFTIAALVAAVLGSSVCAEEPAVAKPVKTGYAPVNGLQMYYEIYGPDRGQTPLVLLHGGGSTIETSFGSVIGELAKTRRVIAFEQQGHGHTADIEERPLSFEQSAQDTVELLKYLGIPRADLCGYSNGGTIALYTTVLHPDRVRKLVLISASFSKEGLSPQLLEAFKTASADNIPPELREAYLKVAPHPEQLPLLVKKSVDRMLNYKDLRAEQIQAIESPTLVINGDNDVILPEHAVKLYHLLPQAQLAIFPGTDHMQIVKRADGLLTIIPAFLDSSSTEIPAQK